MDGHITTMVKAEYLVLVAINQPLLEAGITTLLSAHSMNTVLDIANGSDDMGKRIREKKPDLLIVDYNPPGFITLEDLQSLIRNSVDLNVLVISSDSDKVAIRRSVQSGIKGYITKECGKNEFLLAVESTARGEKFFCSKILNIIIDDNLPDEKTEEASVLTVREQEILKMLAQGFSTQRIADGLHLSPHTVQTHRKSIIRKLKIKSPTQFVIYALDMGLVIQK